MKRILKVIGVIAGIILLASLVFHVVGATLPRDHVASAETIIDAAPHAVAARIGEPAGFDLWRDTHTEILSRDGNTVVYREHAMGNATDYRMVILPDGRHFTSTILSDHLPYGGSWTIEVAPEGRGSKVTVVERGVVGPPILRFLSHYVFGQAMIIQGYLDELKASFET